MAGSSTKVFAARQSTPAGNVTKTKSSRLLDSKRIMRGDFQ
jgi:hypothetical protein